MLCHISMLARLLLLEFIDILLMYHHLLSGVCPPLLSDRSDTLRLCDSCRNQLVWNDHRPIVSAMVTAAPRGPQYQITSRSTFDDHR
jgi:hypothetical protein